jgi:hypothetical protein
VEVRHQPILAQESWELPSREWEALASGPLDPWGKRIEIVGYDNIQFTKAERIPLRPATVWDSRWGENTPRNEDVTSSTPIRGRAVVLVCPDFPIAIFHHVIAELWCIA